MSSLKFTGSKSQKPTLLIDADLYLYRAAAATEEEIHWGDDIWSLSTDLKVAKSIFTDNIKTFCETFETNDFVLAISDADNFRKELFETYKGGRKKVRKPLGYKALVEWAKEEFDFFHEPMLEADDILGILATCPDLKTIVISDDKDMQTLPCNLYRPMRDEKRKISEEEANYYWWLQTLTGDLTDGYGGCPKVGPKTAEKILGSSPSWDKVVSAYKQAGLTEQDAITQARLARILRFEDWDVETATIKLWEPTR